MDNNINKKIAMRLQGRGRGLLTLDFGESVQYAVSGLANVEQADIILFTDEENYEQVHGLNGELDALKSVQIKAAAVLQADRFILTGARDKFNWQKARETFERGYRRQEAKDEQIRLEMRDAVLGEAEEESGIAPIDVLETRGTSEILEGITHRELREPPAVDTRGSGLPQRELIQPVVQTQVEAAEARATVEREQAEEIQLEQTLVPVAEERAVEQRAPVELSSESISLSEIIEQQAQEEKRAEQQAAPVREEPVHLPKIEVKSMENSAQDTTKEPAEEGVFLEPQAAMEACTDLDEEVISPFPYIFKESKWVKKSYPYMRQANHYLVGEIMSGGTIVATAIACPGEYALTPPPWLQGFQTYLEDANGKGGYWLYLRDAKTGNPTTLQAIIQDS